MLRDDFIMRQIERAGQALARALGLQAKGEDDRAVEQLQQAYLESLRVDRHTFEQLDSKSLAQLLGPVELVRTLARILTAEARSLERLERPHLAKLKRTRAVELYLEVGVGPDAEDVEALKELHTWLKLSR